MGLALDELIERMLNSKMLLATQVNRAVAAPPVIRAPACRVKRFSGPISSFSNISPYFPGMPSKCNRTENSYSHGIILIGYMLLLKVDKVHLHL